MNFTWLELLKVGLAAGIVSLVVNHVVALVKDRYTLRRDARYLALRVAVILEKFAVECANCIYELNLPERPAEYRDFPMLLPYPTDTDWKAVDPTLASTVLSFRNEVEASQDSVSQTWKVEFEVFEEVYEQQIGACGYRALKFASDLRRRYNLPALQAEHTGWAFGDVLKQRHDFLMKNIQESKRRQEEVRQRLEANRRRRRSESR